jgi:hypothetical protein
MMDFIYRTNRRLLFTANPSGDELAEWLGARAVSRFTEVGAAVVCDWPSFRGTK